MASKKLTYSYGGTTPDRNNLFIENGEYVVGEVNNIAGAVNQVNKAIADAINDHATKLDTIEDGATADMTGSEIAQALENDSESVWNSDKLGNKTLKEVQGLNKNIDGWRQLIESYSWPSSLKPVNKRGAYTGRYLLLPGEDKLFKHDTFTGESSVVTLSSNPGGSFEIKGVTATSSGTVFVAMHDNSSSNDYRIIHYDPTTEAESYKDITYSTTIGYIYGIQYVDPWDKLIIMGAEALYAYEWDAGSGQIINPSDDIRYPVAWVCDGLADIWDDGGTTYYSETSLWIMFTINLTNSGYILYRLQYDGNYTGNWYQTTYSLDSGGYSPAAKYDLEYIGNGVLAALVRFDSGGYEYYCVEGISIGNSGAVTVDRVYEISDNTSSPYIAPNKIDYIGGGELAVAGIYAGTIFVKPMRSEMVDTVDSGTLFWNFDTAWRLSGSYSGYGLSAEPIGGNPFVVNLENDGNRWWVTAIDNTTNSGITYAIPSDAPSTGKRDA